MKRALAAAVLLTCAVPGRADAFCRSMTKAAPADYNPVEKGGCWAEGVPLFWRNTCVSYDIQQDASRKVSYEDASNLISAAFTRWTGTTCPTNGTGRSRVSIDVRDLGPVACNKIDKEGGSPRQNVVIFKDERWSYGPQVLGLTTVTFDKENGELFGADMEINIQDMQPLGLRDPVPAGTYDFLAVVTHEAGHFLGMAHSDQEAAAMFARYEKNTPTLMRNLTDDDVSGICSVYRSDGDRAVLNGKVTAAPQCDPTPRGGLERECPDATGSCSTVAALWGGATSAFLASFVGLVALARRLRRR